MTQRTVKRISPDFQWPLGEMWHGYDNPWPGPVQCLDCATTGFNPMTKKLRDTFRSWAPTLTLAEAAELREKGVTSPEILRLKKRQPDSDTPILRQNLIEIRAKRKGFWGFCTLCEGSGFIPNPNPAVRNLYNGINLFDEWEPSEPPYGGGWQLWSDPIGAPLSPIFLTPEDLAQWCSKKYKKPDLKGWEKWVQSFKDVTPSTPRPPFRIQSDHFKVFEASKSKYLD